MKISAQTVWEDIQKIRQTVPLIHNITNYVVMNNTANALLALGSSPVMAHAVDEVEDIGNFATFAPTIIRGNASEINAILAEEFNPKGVDSTQKSQLALAAAKELSQRHKCTVVISGEIDFIVKHEQAIAIDISKIVYTVVKEHHGKFFTLKYE